MLVVGVPTSSCGSRPGLWPHFRRPSDAEAIAAREKNASNTTAILSLLLVVVLDFIRVSVLLHSLTLKNRELRVALCLIHIPKPSSR